MKKNLFSTMLALLTIVAMLVSVGCKNYDDDISDINKKLSTMDGSISTISGQVSTLQSTVSSLQSALDAVKAEVAKCADQSDIAVLQAKIDDLDDAIDACEKAIAENKAALDKKLDAATAESTYATIEALGKANTAISSLEGTVASLNTKVEELEAAVKKAHEEINTILSGLQSQIDDIKAQLAKCCTEEQVIALIEKITGTNTLSSVSMVEGIEFAWGEFKGVYNTEGKLTKWNGPLKDEVAKLSKGDVLYSGNEGFVAVQFNPVAWAIQKDTPMAIQELNGLVAPVDFDVENATRYEDTKAGETGVWAVAYKFDETKLKDFWAACDEIDTPMWSLIVNNTVRTGYNQNTILRISEVIPGRPVVFYGVEEEYDEIDGTVAAWTGYPEKVYDAYISKINSITVNGVSHTKRQMQADSIKFGLEFDGCVMTYNPTTVKQAIDYNKMPVVVNVNVESLSLTGTVTTSTVYFTFNSVETPSRETIDYDVNVVGDATIYVTHTATLKKKSQTATTSIASAMKAFGIDNEEAIVLFESGGYEAAVSAVRYDDGETPVLFSDEDIDDLFAKVELVKSTGAATYDQISVTFENDYASGCEYDVLGKSGHFDVTLTPSDYITGQAANYPVYVISNIPLTIDNPTQTEIDSWYNMNAQGLEVASKTVQVYTTTGTSNAAEIQLIDHFKSESGFNETVSAAPELYTDNKGTHPYITAQPVFTPKFNAYLATLSTKEAKQTAVEALYNNVLIGPVHECLYYSSETGWTYYSGCSEFEDYQKLIFRLKSSDLFDDDVVDDLANQQYTVNMTLKAIGGRHFSSKVYVNVIDQTIKGEPYIDFSAVPTISKIAHDANVWSAYSINSVPDNYLEWSANYSAFDKDGYEIVFSKAFDGCDFELATGYNAEGEPDYKVLTEYNNGLDKIRVNLVQYEYGETPMQAYGISVSLPAGKNIQFTGNTVYIKLRVGKGYYKYVSSPGATPAEDLSIEFVLKLNE